MLGKGRVQEVFSWIDALVILGALCLFGTGIGLANDKRPKTKKENSITRADLPAFVVVGIEARTNNAKEATADGIIPKQWQKFFQDGVLEKIPNKVGSNIYAVYTDYASDRNGEYGYLLGAMVKNGTPAPEGMVIKQIPASRYAVLTTETGPLPKVVPDTWRKIWAFEDEGKLKRLYQADFEIYDHRSHNLGDSQVDIYVGIR